MNSLCQILKKSIPFANDPVPIHLLRMSLTSLQVKNYPVFIVGRMPNRNCFQLDCFGSETEGCLAVQNNLFEFAFPVPQFHSLCFIWVTSYIKYAIGYKHNNCSRTSEKTYK